MTFSVSARIYQLLQAHAMWHGECTSSLVEVALEEFLDVIEQCGPEARAVARQLGDTGERRS